MYKHPIMYAIIDSEIEDEWHNFETGQSEDSLTFACLLPSEHMATQLMLDEFAESCLVVMVEIECHTKNETVFGYQYPWSSEDDESEDEDND